MLILAIVVLSVMPWISLANSVTDAGECTAKNPDPASCSYWYHDQICTPSVGPGTYDVHFKCGNTDTKCHSDCITDVERPEDCAGIDSVTTCTLTGIELCDETCGIGVYTKVYTCDGNSEPTRCPYLCCCHTCAEGPGPIPQLSKCEHSNHPEACISCPPGMLSDDSLSGSCFKYVSQVATYAQAVSDCASQYNGSHVMAMTSETRATIMDEFIVVVFPGYVWMGAHYDADSGEWRWTATGEPIDVSSTYWDFGEPDAGNGECVQVCYECDPPVWVSWDCTGYGQYICEWRESW